MGRYVAIEREIAASPSCSQAAKAVYSAQTIIFGEA
jgi:hypothetical protein